MYHEDLTEIAKERLKILYEHTDGFMIAEQDLRLRGPGEFGGIKQSGFMRFWWQTLPKMRIFGRRVRRWRVSGWILMSSLPKRTKLPTDCISILSASHGIRSVDTWKMEKEIE